MSLRSLTTALTLYRDRTFTLEQATEYSGASTDEVVAALRSRGIPVREDGAGAPGRAH